MGEPRVGQRAPDPLEEAVPVDGALDDGGGAKSKPSMLNAPSTLTSSPPAHVKTRPIAALPRGARA